MNIRLLLVFASMALFADAASLGFDRNLYPGDAALALLHRTFAFTGYWLNDPPGAGKSTWLGKRAVLAKNGFGFLILFNGRLYKDLRGAGVATRLGAADGASAAERARKEGFPEHAVVFLDQEEGGRLVPEQLAYVLAWMDAVAKRGYGFGVYCSGIDVKEGDGTVINTSRQIREQAGTRQVHFFVYNDGCPPSAGCAYPRDAPNPQTSGIEFAEVWQMAQSPRRAALTSRCSSTYSKDLCLAPGSSLDIDLSTAQSADPSLGR